MPPVERERVHLRAAPGSRPSRRAQRPGLRPHGVHGGDVEPVGRGVHQVALGGDRDRVEVGRVGGVEGEHGDRAESGRLLGVADLVAGPAAGASPRRPGGRRVPSRRPSLLRTRSRLIRFASFAERSRLGVTKSKGGVGVGDEPDGPVAVPPRGDQVAVEDLVAGDARGARIGDVHRHQPGPVRDRPRPDHLVDAVEHRPGQELLPARNHEQTVSDEQQLALLPPPAREPDLGDLPGSGPLTSVTTSCRPCRR